MSQLTSTAKSATSSTMPESSPTATAAVATSTPSSLAKTMPPRRRKKKPLTPKQKLVRDSAQRRFKIEKLVFVWQEKLFSRPTVSTDTLKQAATYLQPKTYEEVVEERVVQEWCGYPLCDNTARTNELSKFKISLSERKILDQKERANYCSEECYRKSKYYILQLSTEPVWFRDLNVLSDAHIITKDEDFRSAIDRQRNDLKSRKTSEEIKKEYLQNLLGNFPKDTQDRFKIVEKTDTSVATTAVDSQAGLHDCIEGYRIEIKKHGNKPTTLILKKEKKSENTVDSHKTADEPESDQQEIDADDPDALFETMMMLKSMNLDKEDQPPTSSNSDSTAAIPSFSEKKEASQPVAGQVKKPKENANPPAAKSVQIVEDSNAKQQKQRLSQAPSSATVSGMKDTKDTNVIHVKTPKPKKQSKTKQHSNVPELSLFGTIWTLLDRLTTKATRIYLAELQTSKQRLDIPALLKEHEVPDEEAAQLRGQLFSERIVESYEMIRTQLSIHENLQDDIINVIRTFRFSDATVASLNAAQWYMMTLVILKSVADSLLADDRWLEDFEDCCKVVDQSVDMVDACVRVLKVAST